MTNEDILKNAPSNSWCVDRDNKYYDNHGNHLNKDGLWSSSDIHPVNPRSLSDIAELVAKDKRIKELEKDRDDKTEYEILIQKIDGDTPAQKNLDLELKIKELENTRTQSQWISVSDEFPKPYEEVYIWPRPDYGYKCFTGIYDKNYQCWIAESHNAYGSERHKVKVTHWMPSPLPPKVGK